MKKEILTLSFIFLAVCTISAQSNTSKDTMSGQVVFTKAEVEAEFVGGINAWTNYLRKTLNPNIAVNNGSPIGQYQVIARFIVSKTGKISDVVAETNHGFGMEQEVIRIIKKGPDWNPAQQAGITVNAYRRQPVTFIVEQAGVEITSKIPYKVVVGQENIITIDVEKTENENLEVNISNGSIRYKGGNRYAVTANAPGKAVIDIYNIKKKRKQVASASFQIIPKS